MYFKDRKVRSIDTATSDRSHAVESYAEEKIPHEITPGMSNMQEKEYQGRLILRLSI